LFAADVARSLAFMFVCVCVRACMRACDARMRACVRACDARMHACVRALGTLMSLAEMAELIEMLFGG